MDLRAEIRTFLTTRRARVRPEQVGLPLPGSRRRVPGLRREEVAVLAGVSVEYYIQLERGDLGSASDGVLAGLDRALRLDEAERQHLRALARGASGVPVASASGSASVRPGVQQVLDAIDGAAAFVRNRRLDYLGCNLLGRKLFAPMYENAEDEPVNQARFVFFDPAATSFYEDWPRAAADATAMLRLYAGATAAQDGVSELIDELSAGSASFREHWERHDVRLSSARPRRFIHPHVGPLELSIESMQLNADPHLTLLVATAAPGSSSASALTALTVTS
ncbi:MAG: helix-turn-helix transcriptional regulator [Gaiellaceae bacterium]